MFSQPLTPTSKFLPTTVNEKFDELKALGLDLIDVDDQIEEVVVEE